MPDFPDIENLAFGCLETTGWTPAMVALDTMEKAGRVQVWQVELNDFLGTCVKIVGPIESVKVAIDAGYRVAQQLQGKPVRSVLSKLSQQGRIGIASQNAFNPLIQQDVVFEPRGGGAAAAGDSGTQVPGGTADDFSDAQTRLDAESKAVGIAGRSQPAEPQHVETTGTDTMSHETVQALGFIETQGYTAVFEAIDTACKAAQVEVVGKEKLGGGYITVVIRGDVAAVRAAIDAARPKVEGLGKLIAAHVVTRPSSSVLSLLP